MIRERRKSFKWRKQAMINYRLSKWRKWGSMIFSQMTWAIFINLWWNNSLCCDLEQMRCHRKHLLYFRILSPVKAYFRFPVLRKTLKTISLSRWWGIEDDLKRETIKQEAIQKLGNRCLYSKKTKTIDNPQILSMWSFTVQVF